MSYIKQGVNVNKVVVITKDDYENKVVYVFEDDPKKAQNTILDEIRDACSENNKKHSDFYTAKYIKNKEGVLLTIRLTNNKNDLKLIKRYIGSYLKWYGEKIRV